MKSIFVFWKDPGYLQSLPVSLSQPIRIQTNFRETECRNSVFHIKNMILFQIHGMSEFVAEKPIDLRFSIIVWSQKNFKTQVISKVSRALLSSSSLPSSFTLISDITWNCGFPCACKSFYDSSTCLIFDVSIITRTPLKATGDYTLQMLVQQVSHLSLKNYFCVDQSKKFTDMPQKMVQKKSWKWYCDLETRFDINNW